MLPCFVDVQKIFDNIELINIITLLNYNIPETLVKPIAYIHKYNSTGIKNDGLVSWYLVSTNGIRQGNSFRTLLFNIVMN